MHIWKDKLSTTHGHEYYEFAICNKGELVHYLNDNIPQRVKKGQAFFITPNDKHSIKALSGATHINIAFLPKIFVELCKYFEVSKETQVFKNTTITFCGGGNTGQEIDETKTQLNVGNLYLG